VLRAVVEGMSSQDPPKTPPSNDGAPDSPRMFAPKRADLRDLNYIGWAICSFVLAMGLHQSLTKGGKRDFVYFYSAGHLLNHYSPARLYDFALQKKIVEELLPEPLKAGQPGLFVYPPHVAVFFQPFAMLSYWTACQLWLAISLTLYLAGLCLLIKRFCGGDLFQRSLFLWFGLSFWPFIPWILHSGQVSAIGFLAMALAVYWEDLERHFLSGLALSICTYKPTLLLLILPMLLVIRRPRTLAGFGAGAFTAIAVAALAGGPQIWVSYIGASADKTNEIFQVFPVTLDLRALAGAVPHAGRFTLALLMCAAGIAGACLAGLWWRARKFAQHGPATPIWAATITWTLLFNVYVPVYDSVLVLVGIIASAGFLVRYVPRLFCGLCLALLVSSYFSTQMSSQIGWQLLTPVLAAIGFLQMFACWRAIDEQQRAFAANP
jgi:hypothetical protein